MSKKYKVAFIYHKDNPFLIGKYHDNIYYHFFMKALTRNDSIDVTYFPTGQTFDATQLKDKFDVILLWENGAYGMPSEIKGIQELDIPVIARTSDPVGAKDSIEFHKKWKIDYYFNFRSEEYFHELYPQKFKYKTILFGVEPSLYENLNPFNQRIKNKILNSGAIGNLHIPSRIINNIRNPKWNALRLYYLRTMCNKLPYVDYTSTPQQEYVGDKYPLLLEKYQASVAACTITVVAKFWEIPAAGCLTFMEITKRNNSEFLGFIDEESAIFINENNYKEKFKEYLTDIKNPKWEKIANNGKIHANTNFNNDKGVQSLVRLIENIVS